MNKPNWKQYLLWILGTEAVGILSALLSRQGMALYGSTALQPPLSPPMWVFPVVWGILFALMGISAAWVASAPLSRERSRGLNLFITQLILNFFWSPIFFNARAYGLALLWLLILWAVVLLMILDFIRVDKTAGLLQLPYLAWLTFAAYLNWAVWQLNG